MGRTLPFNTYPLIDRFLGAIAREQTDRFRPIPAGSAIGAKDRSGLKVLFTTGYARNAIVHHGRLDPGINLLVKPFTVAALATKIRQILDSP